MKKLIAISFILFMFSFNTSVYSQIEIQSNKKKFIDNVQFGGGFGLSFGNDFFSGTIAPFALYEISPTLSAGAGLNFTYSSFNESDAFIYGGSLISLINPIRDIQFSVELEQLRVNRTIENIFGESFSDDYWFTGLFLGVGYNSRNVTFGMRFNVLHDEDTSIYANAFMPFVRFSF